MKLINKKRELDSATVNNVTDSVGIEGVKNLTVWGVKKAGNVNNAVFKLQSSPDGNENTYADTGVTLQMGAAGETVLSRFEDASFYIRAICTVAGAAGSKLDIVIQGH